MSASSFKVKCIALLVAMGVSTSAWAQLDSHCSPFYGCNNDLQFFDPVDLDIDCRGCCDQCGFFFAYDKIAWSTSGERVEVGDPNTEQRWFQQLPGVPLDPITGDPIAIPTIPNSIQDAIPSADITTGDRFEFGYWDEHGSGWLMSVLKGPDDRQEFTIGLNGGVQDGFQNGLPTPIGDVFVAFRTDPGVLVGFVDLFDTLGPVPFLGDDDNGGGALDGDGQPDDLNGNGIAGYLVPDGNGGFFLVPIDSGDLVQLPVSFGLVNLRNHTQINGFEMMRGKRLDNSHFKVAHQNNHFEWHYGARFLQIDDQFFFQGLGVPDSDFSIGDTQVDQNIVNNIIGPQVGYKWTHNRGRWSINSVGKVLFGFNIRNWDQTGFIAENTTPGNPNSPLYVTPHSFAYGRKDQGFSPTAELRLNVDYRLTDNIKLGAGYTGTFVDNIRRASTHVDYALHDEGRIMGFSNVNEGENIFTNGVNFHIEVTQ